MCVESLTTTDNLWKFCKENYLKILRNIFAGKLDSFLQIQWATSSGLLEYTERHDFSKEILLIKKLHFSVP